MERPVASNDEQRMGSAAFFAPETRTSPRSRSPPLMTILSMGTPSAAQRPGKGWRGLGGRRSGFGLLAAGVLLAAAVEGGRLAAAFLAADLVVVLVAHLVAPPANEVLAAEPLGPHRLLALLDLAGGTLGRGLRGGGLRGGLLGSGFLLLVGHRWFLGQKETRGWSPWVGESRARAHERGTDAVRAAPGSARPADTGAPSLLGLVLVEGPGGGGPLAVDVEG